MYWNCGSLPIVRLPLPKVSRCGYCHILNHGTLANIGTDTVVVPDLDMTGPNPILFGNMLKHGPFTHVSILEYSYSYHKQYLW